MTALPSSSLLCVSKRCKYWKAPHPHIISMSCTSVCHWRWHYGVLRAYDYEIFIARAVRMRWVRDESLRLDIAGKRRPRPATQRDFFQGSFVWSVQSFVWFSAERIDKSQPRVWKAKTVTSLDDKSGEIRPAWIYFDYRCKINCRWSPALSTGILVRIRLCDRCTYVLTTSPITLVLILNISQNFPGSLFLNVKWMPAFQCLESKERPLLQVCFVCHLRGYFLTGPAETEGIFGDITLSFSESALLFLSQLVNCKSDDNVSRVF